MLERIEQDGKGRAQMRMRRKEVQNNGNKFRNERNDSWRETSTVEKLVRG